MDRFASHRLATVILIEFHGIFGESEIGTTGTVSVNCTETNDAPLSLLTHSDLHPPLRERLTSSFCYKLSYMFTILTSFNLTMSILYLCKNVYFSA